MISTKQRGRINEAIEIVAGRESFLVQVDELGLTFHLNQSVVSIQSKDKNRVNQSSESSSGYSSAHVLSTALMNGSHSFCIEEDEVAKAICLEKASLVDVSLAKLNSESEAVHSALNATTMKALGPSSQVDRPLVSWADIVAKILVIQGDKVGEELTQLHNRNIELDPILDRESCDTPIRIFTSDEERAHEVLGGILEVERPILRDGNLTNFVN
ncbi:hypothetical protein V6N13_061938 [Hibiscus sabdariffa]